ncbi:MAG: winged helix-turn-helix transcriptional regulator [Lautropia sp.]
MAIQPQPGEVSRLIRSSSLHRALAALGDRWSVLLIREAFLGIRQFEAFQSRLGIPRQTLTNRLRELVAHDVLYVQPYQTRPLRHAYRLTEKGLGLYPYALLLWQWQRRWSGAHAQALPDRLVHRRCGQATEPAFVCSHCRLPVSIRDVEWHERLGALADVPPLPRAKRQTVARRVEADAGLVEHGAFIVSDRWAHLIIVAVFLGVTTFDGFERELGISSNILARRLRLLVDAQLLRKLPDPDDSRRFHYRLTERSRQLFPISIVLLAWADRWMPDPHGPPMRRTHRTCGQPLVPAVACSGCGIDLAPREVGFEYARDAVPAPAAGTD